MNRKKVAFLTATVLILTLVLSAGFIIINSEHECSGAGCRICSEIHTFIYRLQETLLFAMIFFACIYSYFSVQKVNPAVHTVLLSDSLVSLKVKLSC